MALHLHAERLGVSGAQPVVVLHGLLGASRNWTTIGRRLGEQYEVHLLDLRNHGKSPHDKSMRWSEMCADLSDYLRREALGPVYLVGHSLGGKVAMRYACRWPHEVARLVIVDIAAKAYPPYHDNEFRAMRSLAVGELESRKEAESALEAMVPDWAMRQFLLTNLVRDTATGAFRWQANIDVLHASLPHIRMNSLSDSDRYEGPALLMRGERSNFVDHDDLARMRHWLPRLSEVVVPRAGHNVHVENRAAFLDLMGAWLES